MLRWLRPPQVEDEHERFVYASLHYALQLGFLITLVFLIGSGNPERYFTTLTTMGSIIIVYTLLHKKRLQLAGAIFLTIGLLVGAVSLTQVNGVHNATLYVYVIFIILSNIIFVRRMVVLAVMMVSILTVLIVAVLQERGDIPLREMPVPIVNRAFVAIIIFSITGIVSSYASSALRRNLARVRQNEERYRLLFEYASIMAMVYDSQGKIILANDAAVKWIDKTREEVEGRFIDELASPENAAALKKMNQQALASGEVLEFERTTTDKFGAPVSYLRHVIPLPAIDGPQVLGLSTDITAQKRNLERQQELQAAQEKVAFYTDFFGTISHDLKTPLSVMQTSLYLLQRAENEERRHEKIDQLHHQVNLLEAYIQDMLLVSQLEHVPVLERELVDLPVLMADIVQALQPKIEDKRIDCTIQHQDENLKIQVDRDQIRRALTNLVENAVNYTAVGGRVSVSTSQKKSVVSIEVSDTGIGIQAGDVPHIFDAFYRASEAKSTLSTGSGLGLAIVKRIAELHGGSIVVESKPQQGSCFTLTLPA